MTPRRLFWSAHLARSLLGQAKLPFQRLEAIERRQARRVQRAIRHAYLTVPYYRRTLDALRLRPDDIRTASDLAKLPLLERAPLQRAPDDFLSTAKPRSAHLDLRSGGSSGAPCTVYHDLAALIENAAHGERERSIATRLVGRSFGYREAVIGGAVGGSTAQAVQEFCQERALFPSALRIHRLYVSVFDSIEENLARLDAFRPDVLHSTFGSYLDVLFPRLHAAGKPFHRPKLITYSSDHLSEQGRSLISETLGIPVLSTYQAVEAFKIGFECDRHAGMHLNVDLYPVRIVDAEGHTLPPGENGEVVVSNLVNRATVLLNYRLGDLASILPDPCPCGRSLPLLSFLHGRSDDWIRLPSGRSVHPQTVRTLFATLPELWQYQVVQDAASRLRVSLVTAPTCDRPALRRELATRFAAAFADDRRAEVEFVFVDSIPRTARGKFRTVISEAPPRPR